MGKAKRRKLIRRLEMGIEVQKCKNCKYWKETDPKGGIGECRVGRPSVFPIIAQGALGQPQPGTFSAFPSINGESGWCGEGELKSEGMS